MSSKYLSITTLYTDAQVNIEQFNKILEEKLSWFQEVQETAVKLFGSKTCTLLPKTPSMKRKRPFQKQSELTENSISLSKHSTFVDDLQMHKKIRIDISDIEEKSMLEESLNKSSTDYSSRLRNRKKKSSLAKKKPKRAVTKTSKSYFESPWNANDNKNSSALASMINTSLQTFSSPSKNSNTQQKAVLVIEKLNLSSKTAKTTKEDYSLKNCKDMVKQALFVENPNKGQEVESLIQSDIVKNIPSKSSSPQLYHTSFSIVVEKLSTPKQLNTQSSSPEHTNSNKESTPIEKINGSSKLAKSKLFISINDQLDANIDSSIQKNYCHANSPLTLSPSISPSVSVEDKGSFHPNRTLVLSPSKSVEDKRPLHASVENESPLDSNPTEVLSPPILHETQYSCFVKPQSPPRSPMTIDKIDKNSNIQSLPFASQSEQVVGYHSIQIPNNTQDKYDYTMLTNKENKTETDENVNESDQDPAKCKNDCSEASSDNCDCSQDNEKNETKMIKVTKPGTNILSDVNSLIKQDMTKEPTNLVRIGNIVSAGIKSFMKNQDSPKKETIEEKQQKKHAELKKRDELRQKVIEEQFLKKQKEKEDRKRQREEREKRFAEQIARRQEEEAKRKEQMILKLKQASQNRDEVRKQRELEEVKKRKQRDIKMAEAEARRQKEEEELKKKAIEAREEEKRREEALKIKFELEEQERQRRKIEQEKAEKDRLRQIEEERALDSDRKRREFAERENHRQEVEKKMKEDREKEKIEKQLREEKNKLAEKDIAQGKKHELDRDKLKEKLREDIKLEIQNEKQAKSNLFSGQVSVNAQNLTMKTLHVHVDDVEKLKPPNALMPFIKSPAAFREQPSTWKPPTIPLVVQDTSYISYGLDLDSDDSTDDECEPSKAVPMWAQGINLKRQLMQQFYTDVDPELIFINAMPPCSLEKIFQKRKERYFKRTSSAHWTSPILKAKVF